MRRTVVLLTVMAMMVVMMATAVAPAFAKNGYVLCTNPTTGDQVGIQAKDKKVWAAQGYTECRPYTP